MYLKPFFKTFLISFAIFLLIFASITFFIIRSDNLNGDQGLGGNFFSRLRGKNEITFLLLGIDAKDLSKSKGTRTDTMMVIRYNGDTGDISMLSIPRDTRTEIKGRKSQEKLNHAHAYGGPELALDTVNKLLGLKMNYYVRVDYKIVEELVDIIGGVEIDVPKNMVYSDPVADPPLHINIKKGRQVLDGEKALQYLRYRKGYANQDLGRIDAQQNFMKEAIKQGLKPANIIKLPQIIESSFRNLDTNIPVDTVMKFSLKAKNIDTDNIKSITLPGSPQRINGVWYFVHDQEKTKEAVKSIFTEPVEPTKE